MGVADLGTEAIIGLMARPGVVHRDPGRARQPGAQHLACFRVKAAMAGGQQADHLAFGNVDAQAAQQRHQPRHCGLSLMILGEHETAQLRPEMAIEAIRQRRRYDLAIGCQPALALKVDDVRMQHQLLNHKAGVALETRAGRRCGQLDFAFFIDRQLGPRAAAAAPLVDAAHRLWIGLLHAARFAVRLDLRPRRTALEPCDLVALRRNRSAQIGHLLQQLHHQQLQLGRRKSVNVLGQRHARRESDSRRFENLIIVPLPRLLPLLPTEEVTMSKTHGKFVWYDVMTSDTKAAESFYGHVVGWTAKDAGMPNGGYTLFSAGPTMVGGLMPIPPDACAHGARPCWTGYVGVDDVDAYAARVTTAGGAIHRAPQDIPGIGRF